MSNKASYAELQIWPEIHKYLYKNPKIRGTQYRRVNVN